MRDDASPEGHEPIRPREEGPRFPCGETSPGGSWRLSRTLLSVRGPDGAARRLHHLHVPIAGTVSDDGHIVILDRQDAGIGRYALSCYGPDGARNRSRLFHAQRAQLGADPRRGRVFLLTDRASGEQVLSAHRLTDAASLWSRRLALDRPVLRVDPARRHLLVRHARSPPGLPYVERYTYDGERAGHLPADGAEVLALAERALELGRDETARNLLRHLEASMLVAEEAPRLDALTARLGPPAPDPHEDRRPVQ